MEDPAANQGQQKVIAGVVILAIAVAIGAYVVTSNVGDGETACALAATGLGLVADGVSRNKSAVVIVAEVGGIYALSKGCKNAINSLVSEPTEPVELEIETSGGDTTQQRITGAELAEPPPPPPVDIPRALACVRWGSDFLYRLCMDRALEPPARPY